MAYINDEHLQPVHLLVTHGHLDHNFGNNTVYETFGLQPEVSEADLKMMENLASQAKTFYQLDLNYNFPAVGRTFQPNEVISFGNHQLSVIETPGHSRGSVTFYCKKKTWLSPVTHSSRQALDAPTSPAVPCFKSSTACVCLPNCPTTPSSIPVTASPPALAGNWPTTPIWTDNISSAT